MGGGCAWLLSSWCKRWDGRKPVCCRMTPPPPRCLGADAEQALAEAATGKSAASMLCGGPVRTGGGGTLDF